MPRKTANLAVARERRLKLIALVGALLLAVLVAIQAPRLLNTLGGGNDAAPAASGATEPVVEPASPSTSGAAPSTASAAAPARLADSDLPPKPEEGDLESFERFRSKDPFVQQVAGNAAPSGTPPVPTSTPSAGTTGVPATTAAPTTAPTSSSSSTYATPSTGSSGTATLARSAVVSVNGAAETVSISQAFPASDPMFRLVSVNASSGEVGIVGGAFSSGAKTVTLLEGKALTLMNTSDGKRYRLRLLSVG